MRNTNYKNWHYEHAKVWKIMPSPARPSIGEVSIFQKYLENYQENKQRKIKVLILGSTPEFRDLCHKERFDVTCIDINQPIYLALTLLQKNPNKQEKFIHGNWLTFGSKEKYNVILGDAVTAMFSLDFYEQFFKNMNRYLVKNGLLILRVPYQDEKFNLPLERVMQNYRKMSNVHIYTATYNFLVMNYLNKDSSSISLSFLEGKIKELLKGKALSTKEYNELKPYYKNLTLELFYPKEEHLLSETKKYFQFLAKEFSLDYLTSYSNPIFVFSK